jgi:hypothetical protein
VRRASVAAFWGYVALTSAAVAQTEAPPERVFGDQAEVVVTGDLSASVGFLSYSASNASSNSASFEPSLDYFFSRNLSLGASVLGRYGAVTSANGVRATTTAYGAQARFARQPATR